MGSPPHHEPARVAQRRGTLSRMGEQLGRGHALLTRLWLGGARRLEQRRRGVPDIWEQRRAWIRELAPDRSFLDVGGMFHVAGDVSFWAEDAGATSVVLFDGMDPSLDFQAKHAERGSGVHYQQADLHDPEDVAIAGAHDIVWCTGVVYHSPSPFQQLLHLRELTRHRLVLGTHVIPEIPGIENGCLFYPGRSAVSEASFAHAHGPRAGAYPGATGPFDDTPNLAYANMWWGITPSALHGMLRLAGFAIEAEVRYSRFLMDVVARPVATPDHIPPLGFSRERGRGRLAAVGDDVPAWAAARSPSGG
jgi:hypothetical protein